MSEEIREMEAKELASGSTRTLRATEADREPCVAGREFDALIAEHVMEWRNVRLHIGVGYGGYDPLKPICGIQTVPAYSTETEAAMQVVERLRKQGFGFVMSDNMDHAPLWNVDVVGELKIEGEAHAESLSLAICLAALKAMEQHSADTDALRG